MVDSEMKNVFVLFREEPSQSCSRRRGISNSGRTLKQKLWVQFGGSADFSSLNSGRRIVVVVCHESFSSHAKHQVSFSKASVSVRARAKRVGRGVKIASRP